MTVLYSDSGYAATTTTAAVKNEHIVKAHKRRVRKGDRKAYESIWPGQFNRFNRKKW